MAYKGRQRQQSSERVLQPLRREAERAERLRALLEELAALNLEDRIPIIVEGKRDREALKTLGIKGEIITYNQGKGVHEFCEQLAEERSALVLLMDWDREGDRLQQKLGSELEGLWEEFSRVRDTMRLMCQKEVKDVEGLPSLLRRLEAGLVEDIPLEDTLAGEQEK